MSGVQRFNVLIAHYILAYSDPDPRSTYSCGRVRDATLAINGLRQGVRYTICEYNDVGVLRMV